jgi:ABC-2 type transport system permease protein
VRTLVDRLRAFVRRDCRVAISYRFEFVFRLATGFFIVATFYFVSKLIGPRANAALAQYNTDYFSFVLVGIAASNLLNAGLTAFAAQLRGTMVEGTLEAMFATPTRPSWILMMPCLWAFFFEAVRASVLIFCGVVIFGAHLSTANLSLCLCSVILAVSAYSVFGLLSAAIILVVKRGEPINWAFAHASAFVAGAFFPVELFPSWLEHIARILPTTYAFHSLRMSLLTSCDWSSVAQDFLVLGGFTLIGLPLAIYACHLAIEKVKVDGTLSSF